MKAMTRYKDEQIIVERTVRATSTVVQIVWNGSADPDQPWETICVPHGGVCSHQTRKDAEAWMPHPDEWCEVCMYGEVVPVGMEPA